MSLSPFDGASMFGSTDIMSYFDSNYGNPGKSLQTDMDILHTITHTYLPSDKENYAETEYGPGQF